MVKKNLDLGSLRFYESYKGHYFIDLFCHKLSKDEIVLGLVGNFVSFFTK